MDGAIDDDPFRKLLGDEKGKEMKICYVGSLKPKFTLKIKVLNDDVLYVKELILERLGLY